MVKWWKFDDKNNKPTGVSQPTLFKDTVEETPETEEEKTPEEILASIPKHRGRKSKAELEAIAAAEAALKAKQEVDSVEDEQKEESISTPDDSLNNGEKVDMDEEGFIPEDQFVPENEQESGHDDDMLARLQEKS